MTKVTSCVLGLIGLVGCALDEEPDMSVTHERGRFSLDDHTLIELEYEQRGNAKVFEDDIVLDVERPDIAELTVIPTNIARRWPDGVIPYTIDSSLHDDLKPRIQAAIAEWESKTNIRLVHRSNQTNYVTFTRPDEESCSAQIGMQGGQQFIWLSRNRCVTARVIHEIGHAVGMWHEHSRSDRDRYIVIHWENIIPEKRDQFRKISEYSCFDRITGGVLQCPELHTTEYDLDSRMHYDSFNFSSNGKHTITRWFDGGHIPMVAALSPTDAAGVVALYHPVPGPGSSTPLWRYYNGSNVDHFYTIDRNDGGMAYYGYGFETSEGGVFRTQLAGTVPIYQYWNPTIGDHFFTQYFGELGWGANGYTLEKVAGYIFPVAFNGTVALFRYFNGNDHFYTRVFAPGAYGYNYEGVLGYVY